MDLPGRSNNDNLEDSGLAAARHKWIEFNLIAERPNDGNDK